MKDKVNVAVIGMGGRGQSMLRTMLLMDDINVIGVCDKYEDRTQIGVDKVEKSGRPTPFATMDYLEILSLDGLDSVYVATDWEWHARIATEAMKRGIRTAVEVGGAYSLDECWEMVDAYEETGAWAMMMENCCYGEREMMVHNMVRQGMFGKLVFCSGQYAHDLREEVGYGTRDRHYRLRNYLNRNCENYPTHELGPIAKILEINRGNRMLTLNSFATGSYGMEEYVQAHEDLHEELGGKHFAQADIVKTIITTERGEMIELTLDTTLPRFYSRGFTVRGTKGMYQEDGDAIFLDKKAFWEHDCDAKRFRGRAARYANKYNSDIWKKTTEDMMNLGHGGMDWHVIRAWVEALKNDTLPPLDVYDAAAWMCISALSEQSIAEGGKTVEIPDFTRGKYKNRTDKAEGKYAIE